jgi:hypothetical protein
MHRRCSIWAATVAAVLASAMVGARATDAMKYPDWEGQWERVGSGATFDPSKPPGRGQQPPLTPEYQAIWETHLADTAAGGQIYNPQVRCYPGGMPRMMMAYDPMEVIVTPQITYMEVTFFSEFRRIYTDGRDWPKNPNPTFSGYSIGKWIDADAAGRYDVLEVETRDLRGPRTFDGLGTPMHEDNQTVIKERMYLDKSDPNILHDQITTIDHALTRPWTVMRSFHRVDKPLWMETPCADGNHYVFIGNDTFVVSMDGFLMPTKKNQPPPDLKYFERSGK